MMCYLYAVQVLLEMTLKTSHAAACGLSKGLGNLRVMFMTLELVFPDLIKSLCDSDVTQMLSTCVNITGTTNSS
jgi:hypothetical protein